MPRTPWNARGLGSALIVTGALTLAWTGPCPGQDLPLVVGHPGGDAALRRPVLVPGEVLLTQSDLEALGEGLARSVFRAEASQVPPEPYEQVPMVYDGAVVAIDHEGLAFLTTAGWISGASDLVLLDGEARVPLKVERVDARSGLALLRLSGQTEEGRFAPVPLARQTPLVNYALLSPGTKYALLASVSVLPEERAESPLYWTTTLGATNGYPVFDAQRALVAVQVRRAEGNSSTVGEAIGWPLIGDFLVPPTGRAEPRAPDSTLDLGRGGFF